MAPPTSAVSESSFGNVDAGRSEEAIEGSRNVWPSGWAWHEGSPASNDYFLMIVGVYATLGIFLILAARDPHANRSLILFTIWSSLVHAAIMTVQSIGDPMHQGHLLGDVPALVLVAVVLGWLYHADRAHQAAMPA